MKTAIKIFNIKQGFLVQDILFEKGYKWRRTVKTANPYLNLENCYIVLGIFNDNSLTFAKYDVNIDNYFKIDGTVFIRKHKLTKLTKLNEK